MNDPEYAIIGGGIAGASVAYHLSRRTTAPITVFERQSLASETTYKSVAMTGLYGDETQYRMKQYALELYNRFFEDAKANPQYRSMGRLLLSTTGEGARRLRRAVKGEATVGKISYGPDRALMEYIPGDELRQNLLLPPVDTDGVQGAIFRPKVGYMTRPQELAYEFIERAKANGVAFQTNTRVEEIHTKRGRVVGLDTDAGRVDVGNVVCAAGPWNIRLARQVGLDLPLKHTLAPIIQLRPPEPLEYSLPSVEYLESSYAFHRRQRDELLLGYYPGSYDEAGTEFDPHGVSDSVPPDIKDSAIEFLERRLPSLLDSKVVDEWVGVRSMTPDQNPIVGWTDVEGFSIAAFNTSGIQLAPAVGRVIADQLVDGEPTEYYDALSVTRFDGHGDVRPDERPERDRTGDRGR